MLYRPSPTVQAAFFASDTEADVMNQSGQRLVSTLWGFAVLGAELSVASATFIDSAIVHHVPQLMEGSEPHQRTQGRCC